MNWNLTMGYVSTAAQFVPVALILILRMYKNRSLLALLVYYSIALLSNLMQENILPVPPGVLHFVSYANNFLDTPLSLIFLLYFTHTARFRRTMHITLGVYLAFEIVTILLFGFQKIAVTIILGPGFALILILSIRFFIRQIEAVVQHDKAPGKALMIASTLFSYGGFFIVYLFYFVFQTKDTENTFLVFYLVSTFSSALLAIGLLVEKKRFRELAELRIARKELSMLYPDEKPATPKETAGSLEEDEELI
ncbi:MAG TPA: hypothetical protein VG870_04750 [Chitinophagaceae bacterium]|nr:hypothetical protein [Chitinophagaceae bacterium]